MSTIKVKGHTHLVRDLKSQAIINTDSDAYARYMARKVKQQKKEDEMRKVVTSRWLKHKQKSSLKKP